MQKYDYFLDTDQNGQKEDIIIHNVGFSQCPPNDTSGWDMRDYFLIHYCTSGKGIYYVSGREYPIEPHDGFLITPETAYMHLADQKDPWNLCWVGFHGSKIETYLNQAVLTDKHPVFRYTRDNLIETCIENLYDNARIPDISPLTLTGYLYILLGALINNHANADTPKISISHFEKVSRYIKHNIRSSMTIQFLAAEHNIAPSQLYRSFMACCGMSPKQYLDTQKINKACDLMEKTDLSTKEIAAYLGYEYETHFYKTFKKFTGIKPSEYRQEKAAHQS